eukprot:Mrub_08054.p1 GENE.Mrub_08054~~Mrub_08054.p1  ORF type:complete len:245 (-),score=27.35 Mrub_08054:131-808(-)
MINYLILDYFIFKGRKQLAETFSKECDIPLGEKQYALLNSFGERKEITEQIQNGQILDAISKINNISQEIISKNSYIEYILDRQQLIELIRSELKSEALQYVNQKLYPIIANDKERLNEIQKILSHVIHSQSALSKLKSVYFSDQFREETATKVNDELLKYFGIQNSNKLIYILKQIKYIQDQIPRGIPKLNSFSKFKLTENKYSDYIDENNYEESESDDERRVI